MVLVVRKKRKVAVRFSTCIGKVAELEVRR